MKVYISGPMTGIAENNFPAFIAACDKIRKAGHDPVSPHAAPVCETWEEYMKYDIQLLCGCDAIYMLDGWKHSRGAKMEKAIAILLGLEEITWD